MASDFAYIVVGLGQTGLSAARFLARRGLPFAIVDTRPQPPGLATLQRELPGVEIRCGDLEVDFLCRAHTLLVSPGLSLAAPALQAAAAAGVRLSGDVDLFAQEAQAPLVAITGSNAKSTVTTLVGEMAAEAGLRVAVGGNLGTPVLDLLGDDIQLYVLELSSFQLASTRELKAAVATCLNLSEDHMDRHGDMAHYAQAKARIFVGAQQVVFNRGEPRLDNESVAELWSFGLDAPCGDRQLGIHEYQGARYLARGEQRLLPVAALKIRGAHNQLNALAALALGYASGLPKAAMQRVLQRFSGLPHRCQWVLERQGVTFYDDSKATNVGAALAAINGLGEDLSGQLVLIAGGDGKGGDFAPLFPAIKRFCRAVILIGRDGPLLARGLTAAGVPWVLCDALAEAVVEAAQRARPGDAVLLSPACASLDMFRNFEERGRCFAAAAQELDK